MKKFLFFSLIVCVFSSCEGTRTNQNVSIKAEKKVIKIGEKFSAKLSVPYCDSVLPVFHIINNNDTFLLPFDATLKQASFEAMGRKEGKNNYDGFVEYLNKDGQTIKTSYKIVFVVD